MNRWNNCLHLEKISNYEITTTAFFFVVDKNKSEKTSKPAITLALLIEVSCNDFKSESNLDEHHVEFSFLTNCFVVVVPSKFSTKQKHS